MSSTTVFVFIALGIVVLIFIVSLNNMLEKNKLNKARRKAELIDRQRRCSTLSETLPSQLISVELKQLLHRIELPMLEELTRVDVRNTNYQKRIDDVRQMLAQGNALAVNNLQLAINSDAQIKEVRFQLESLEAQIIRAVEDKVIPVAEGKQWLEHIRQLLVRIYIDYFSALGRDFLQKKRANQARLVFERALQFLKKQKNADQYQQPLREFESLLKEAQNLTVELAQPQSDDLSELTAALVQEDEHEAEWKKKHIYD